MISVKENEMEPPSFKLLTITAAASKDSKGNKDLNIEAFESSLSREVLNRYGGNITDNANDAKKESRDTFNAVTVAGSRIEHGVIPRMISICDSFHGENLAVTKGCCNMMWL